MSRVKHEITVYLTDGGFLGGWIWENQDVDGTFLPELMFSSDAVMIHGANGGRCVIPMSQILYVEIDDDSSGSD